MVFFNAAKVFFLVVLVFAAPLLRGDSHDSGEFVVAGQEKSEGLIEILENDTMLGGRPAMPDQYRITDQPITLIERIFENNFTAAYTAGFGLWPRDRTDTCILPLQTATGGGIRLTTMTGLCGLCPNNIKSFQRETATLFINHGKRNTKLNSYFIKSLPLGKALPGIHEAVT